MPPKAGGAAKKSKKSAKPEWMSDDVWAVSQDLPSLLYSFAGIKSDKPAKADKSAKSDKAAPPGKGGKSAKPEPLPNIPKAQVLVLHPRWMHSSAVVVLPAFDSCAKAAMRSCR